MDLSISSQPPSEYATWHPPLYHVVDNSTPPLLSRTTLEHDPDLPDNFPRTAKWCADGSSLMVQCENRSFQLFSTTNSLEERKRYESRDFDLASNPRSLYPISALPASSRSLIHAKTLPQPAPIVDFAWYPGASRHNSAAYCFVASVRDCPVKLLDAGDGRLRASYPIVDHRERQIAPHSLAFNLAANKLYCGFEDAIEMFDVQSPGQGERLPTTSSKKSKDGLKGIISCLAFSYSPEYYAAGSLTPASRASDNIALFDESTPEAFSSIGGVAEWEKGGVTQLMFNPTRPHVLYAAFRRSERIWSWDLRGDPSIPLCYFSRGAMSNGSSHKNLTNQRMQFDVENAGLWLASGSQLGEIAMYDLRGENSESGEGEFGGDPRQVGPALLFEAHNDAAGAVAFHPLNPVLLSVSGSRQFDSITLESTLDESGSDSESSDESIGAVRRMKGRPRPSVNDASIKQWDFQGPEGT